jgi:hypothetical protein
MLPFSALSAKLEPYQQPQLYKFAEMAIFVLVANAFGSGCIIVKKSEYGQFPNRVGSVESNRQKPAIR